MYVSETQKKLLNGLNLLELDRENKLLIMLALKTEEQQWEMLEWMYQCFKKDIMPTQPQVMDKFLEITQQ